jgi:hypothetical protein
MIVAFVALFIAGAGSATAARLITGKQIRNSSITSTDVRNGSLLRRDFRSGQLPRGPQGLPGASGRAGRDGFGQVTYGSGEVKDVSSGAFFFGCPAGLVPVGGDAYAVDDQEDIVPAADIADYFYANNSSVPNAWGATLGAGSANVDLIIEVICANSSQTTVTSAPAKSGGATAAKPRE